MCGLSTRKIRTPRRIQKRTRPSALPTTRASPVALEVEGINVLVLLRRIFGILHAAVGPMAKPLRMLSRRRGDRASIGRPCPSPSPCRARPAFASRRSKSSSVPSSGCTALCPPLGRADRPGTARIAGAAVGRAVLALAVSCGRWDGSAADRARRSPSGPRRASDPYNPATCPAVPASGHYLHERGNIFVPSPEAGPFAIDDDLQFLPVCRAQPPVADRRHPAGKLARSSPVRRPLRQLGQCLRLALGPTPELVDSGPGPGGSLHCLPAGRDLQFNPSRLPAAGPLAKSRLPRFEVIDPGLDRIAVTAHLDTVLGLPAIVAAAPCVLVPDRLV